MADYEAHDYSGRIRDWHRRRWGRKGLARERRPPAAGGTIRSLDWIGPSCGARRPPPRTFIAHQRNSEKGPAPGRAYLIACVLWIRSQYFDAGVQAVCR